ncbi:collagen-like triple helix repeat-containing protein [Micromonospora sp. WMMA1923]|uniref:collagen-like triple helix repeat-containing protein n=1 Tax=Micromonospora sp. WMMA1923 TaxID=3404125 RepID=UPI003B94AADD
MSAGSLLTVLPVATMIALAYAVRPVESTAVAPWRLAVVRAALITGGYAVVVVELFGALGVLTRPAFAAAWLLLLAAAATAAWRRHHRDLATRSAAAGGPGEDRGVAGRPGRPDAAGGPGEDRGAAGRPGRSGAAGLVGRLRTFWGTTGVGDRLLAGTVGVLILVELLIALLAEPNNFDSQTYHLPKVEHWVAQGTLEFWPTAIHRQVTIPPGAEYLLLHLRLFTGSDVLHNLVQWAAGVLCVLVVARITAQLGGGRRAQLLSAFVLATTPMIALQATSTQTDLVVAAWVACVATLVLDGLHRRSGPATVLALGAATGLTAVTKTSGLIGVGPLLLLWGLAQLRLAYTATRPTTDHTGRAQPQLAYAASPGRDLTTTGPSRATAVQGGADPGGLTTTDASRTAAARGGAASGGGRGRQVAVTVLGSVSILLVAALLVGPFLVRVTAEFGHPLGPPRLRESIPMERHDPPAILVNALRIGHTALDTPLTPLGRAAASAIVAGAEAIGVDPQDRAITFGRENFPEPSWYPDEDRVAFPLAGSLVLIAAVLALARPARVSPTAPGSVRAYATVVLVTLLLHTSMIKWQPWGNRLLVYALTFGVPLAGLWLATLLRRRYDDTSAGAGRDSAAAGSGDGGGSAGGGAGGGSAGGGSAGGGSGRRSVAAGLVVTVLATSALAGVLALSYGFPRRLVGAGSVFTTSEWDTRFLRRPQWADEFRWAADAVRADGARRIGLVQQNDNWEYPWWLLLRDADGGSPELVALQSVLPERPPADPASVDAIVCTGTRSVCADLVPEGWQVRWRGYVGYALPPTR